MSICICITEFYTVHLKLTKHCKSNYTPKKSFFFFLRRCNGMLEYNAILLNHKTMKFYHLQ